MFLAIIAAIALATPVPPSQPSEMTLSDLQALCGEREPGDACRFYILGVMEGTSIASGLAKDKSHFCTPPGVTQTEIVAVVKRLASADLARYPEDAMMPAVSFTAAALLKAYPCGG